jgi:hypothetical protein
MAGDPLIPGNEPQPVADPIDEMTRSEPLGDDDEVIETENIGLETPGGGEYPDRDTPPDEDAGAPG